ncbi:MAG: hypothetical protein HQK58_13955 [Deltaproteobacteria bacterium]|nr:hypothetical protein [Deltaproteobacteria bacterium]
MLVLYVFFYFSTSLHERNIMSSSAEQEKQLKDKLNEAIKSEQVDKVYVNGFTCYFDVADVLVLFEQNNQAKIAVNMSYTLAKTLGTKLLSLIRLLEEKTGQEIMTTDYIHQKINLINPDENEA